LDFKRVGETPEILKENIAWLLEKVAASYDVDISHKIGTLH